jgi:hypothetical protein
MTEETCGDKRCGRRAAGSFQLGKKEIILHDMTLTHLAYRSFTSPSYPQNAILQRGVI